MEDIWIELTKEALDVGAAAAFLATPGAGGLSLFVGTTRRWTGEQETEELAYDAYAPMAEQEMRRLVAQAQGRWPVLKACVLHRLGVVPVAEASVVVGVATPHRAEAFDACRFLIDALKQQVPIWKREHYADGSTAWVQGSAPPALQEEIPSPEADE